MSIENEIAGLTQSTTDLLEAVNTKKATLDTAVSNAQTAVTDATSQVSLAAAEKVGAQTARDEAESFKDQAYTYSQSAASAVAYQDLTAIAQTKAETAVDVFVYDTSKDSDGGAWRKRTQHTSWYNETLNTATRGSRKEFPAVAVIVAESDKVTIYDGDDPSMPMWMVFNAGSGSGTYLFTNVKAVSAKNGVLVVGVNPSVSGEYWDGGCKVTSFLTEELLGYSYTKGYGYLGGVVARNDAANRTSTQTSLNIVNPNVNDVAMTVLPDAPIDPDTGLPIPTIAVATNGGVSVIKDDGTVVSKSSNLSNYTSHSMSFHIQFDGQDVVFTIWNNYAAHSVARWDLNLTTMKSVFSKYPEFPNQTDVNVRLPISSQNFITNDMLARDSGFSMGANDGLFNTHEQEGSPLDSLVNAITSEYNTGWMSGDIKLATLSDTDDTDLVGSELVTNGTFDTGISGWSSEGGGTAVWDNGTIKVSDVTSNMYINQEVPVTIGKTYTLSLEVTSMSGQAGLSSSSSWGSNVFPSVGYHSYTVKATTGTLYIGLYSATAGGHVNLDNISVRLAEPDRSVNNNGLQVFGTVQKNPVATGADLVAYGGFSPTNYLQQPYNSDLDFGTGDFCVMGWVNSDYASNKHLFAIVDGQGSSWGLNGFIAVKYDSSTSKLQFILAGGMLSTVTPTANTWQHVCLLRKTGVLYAYLDGKLVGSQINTNNLGATTADSKLYLGTGVFNGNVLFNDNSKQALWRVSKTAPTAEQIKKIYEDEKVLFQENAKATLHGTSDAVTALAYDTDTELLHVGTSAGRSVFQGLRRVDNTTDAVGVAISASNNLVVEE